jgi:hypothetical protein
VATFGFLTRQQTANIAELVLAPCRVSFGKGLNFLLLGCFWLFLGAPGCLVAHGGCCEILLTNSFFSLCRALQVIADITRRMGAGMAEFIPKEVVTIADYDKCVTRVLTTTVPSSRPRQAWFPPARSASSSLQLSQTGSLIGRLRGCECTSMHPSLLACGSQLSNLDASWGFTNACLSVCLSVRPSVCLSA